MIPGHRSARRLAAWLALGLAALLAAPACKGEGRRPKGASTDAGTSPNASILPAPLASSPPDFDAGGDASPEAAARAAFDASAPAEPLRPFVRPSPDPIAPRELTGVALQAVFRLRDVPAAHKGPEVEAEGVRQAADLTAPRMEIDLAELGRMRIAFASRALPLPERSEIRARIDRHGHLVVWPRGDVYRVLAPGALRALVGERRVDVTPLAPAKLREGPEGKRLGLSTRFVLASGAYGDLEIELGRAPEAGAGAVLLCRALLELAGVDPLLPVCRPGDLPVSASFRWAGGGGIGFEVTSLTRRSDLPAEDLLVPPPAATFATSGLPQPKGGAFLTDAELAALRGPGAPPDPGARPEGAPARGLVVSNQTEVLQYLLLDGLPVLYVAPYADAALPALPPGRYVAQMRTFLGDAVGPAEVVDVPARMALGVPDAGAPDGG